MAGTNTKAVDGGIGGPDWFATTHWTVVLTAKDPKSGDAQAALETLCRNYWRPLVSYLRREGHSPVDAEDLTQAFFAHLLERDFLSHLRHRDGKFRSFLLKFLKLFLSDERDKVSALKRGGGRTFVSLEEFAAEAGHLLAQSGALSPDQAFEKRWAQMVIDHALERLRQDYLAAGKSAVFEALKDLQPGSHGASSYVAIGRKLGLSESGVKSAVHRLRRRHQEILREEIAQTVTRPEELDAEIRHLIAVMSG